MNHAFFTPEDFSGDEDLIAKTTEQFVKQEIVSQMENIEQHNYKVSRQLFESWRTWIIKYRSPRRIWRIRIRKGSFRACSRKMGYAGAFSVSFNIHAGVGTLPYIYYGTKEQKKNICRKLHQENGLGLML